MHWKTIYSTAWNRT